jgi:hypothetical protein
MLDAYIIDRIRRERERARQGEHDGRIPLHIEPPRPRDRDEDARQDDLPREDPPRPRGSVIIDFQV